MCKESNNKLIKNKSVKCFIKYLWLNLVANYLFLFLGTKLFLSSVRSPKNLIIGENVFCKKQK